MYKLISDTIDKPIVCNKIFFRVICGDAVHHRIITQCERRGNFNKIAGVSRCAGYSVILVIQLQRQIAHTLFTVNAKIDIRACFSHRIFFGYIFHIRATQVYRNKRYILPRIFKCSVTLARIERVFFITSYIIVVLKTLSYAVYFLKFSVFVFKHGIKGHYLQILIFLGNICNKFIRIILATVR